MRQLLSELEAFGANNDRVKTGRPQRMLNITRETGELLAVLVKCTKAKRILEIGTSNGYSTLWLTEAARSIQGVVTTVECSDYKIGLATQNFQRANLVDIITQVKDDAGSFLSGCADESYEMIFLDAERSAYLGYWQDLRRVLCQGGLLVADNAISHQEQLAPLVAMVESDDRFRTCLIPVGNGEYLATRAMW
jgi:predicted O-methyltransferase YrrM